ncbi:Glyoxylate/hydroxypyruvate reductase A [Paraburkholderia caffeinitolerans]|uniref:Glyoxylate/hydroxypyruvate reductase A n=1 Tax=Paraburkholderia caffeinitolerans TaxID=1723730 RepID=A0A6J5FRM0_9BURK|nr:MULTISPECIES: glyoxylate/hydroxypyruvate reductase A [Paraburkholderia]CAB3784085.1 Glyoxylate/hydroxypyruvate reductase A [Paraburkholderia caffeinitolerans]
MKILFWLPQADATAWLDGLSRALPGAELRAWQPGDTAPADYAVVWHPPRELFATQPDLCAVFNLGAGVDAILALERESPGTLPRDALLVRLEDSGMAPQMAEYVQHAVLRYLRRFDEYTLQQARREWHVLAPHPLETFTVGVLGLGVLGAHVARAVASLGVPVRGFSRSAKTLDGIETFSGELRGPQFDAFLADVKVLVNLLPATPDTENVLDARTFGKLPSGAYLVNVARGAHLVEQDLVDALANGTLSAATLDVFNHEPLADDHPFWREPRITITPHSSALTLREEAISQVADKIEALARGETVSGIVNTARGY